MTTPFGSQRRGRERCASVRAIVGRTIASFCGAALIACKLVCGSARVPASLVDCTSFEVMCRRGLDTALAFDHHFTERGYMLPPTDGATGT